jgi:signal transduction histidine kinase
MEMSFVKDSKKMTRWSIFPSSSYLESVHLKQIILPSIFLSFVAVITILVSSNDWMVSDADHFYFEMFAVLLSTIIAFYCISRAYLLQEKFSLFVGIGFATVAVVDLLHAVFSYNAAGNSVFLDYFIPQTWFAGRTFLGVMLVVAVIKYAMPPPPPPPPPPQQQPSSSAAAAVIVPAAAKKREKEENAAVSSSNTNTNKLIHNNNDTAGQYHYSDHTYSSSSFNQEQQQQSTIDGDSSSSSHHHVGLQKMLLFSLLLFSTLAISIVAVSFFTYFPGIRLADFPIHRPYEIPALVLFLIALFFFYKKKLYKANDAFYKGILGALIIDIFGQIVMSFSATNFHTAHNIAHILKDSGYFIIIISLAISSIQYNKLARDRENIIRLQYAKLREADKMKDDFINTAAHELRTPIQPILGVSDLLRSRITDDDDVDVVVEQRQFLDIIIRNAKRLQRLTENILDVTKIESSLFTLRKERFDLNDVIISTIDDVILATDFLKKQEKVRISYHPKQILVYADKSRLTQVIANLIGNSVKFTTEGTISITAEESNSSNNNNGRDEIIIRVQDTGQGIDPDILPALFSKFVSNSSSGGTGLGLFISKKIVEAHGGRIWAENNSDGKKGATFTFTLPITNSHHYHYHNHHYMNNNNKCELL